jgi:hypothetical protein
LTCYAQFILPLFLKKGFISSTIYVTFLKIIHTASRGTEKTAGSWRKNRLEARLSSVEITRLSKRSG